MTFQHDANNRNRIVVTNERDGATITLYQQGAHLTSWRTKAGEEHLYTSPTAEYKDGKAIRGGVPLIFPQFSNIGDLPVPHGFLRTSDRWVVTSSHANGDMQDLSLTYHLNRGEERCLPDGECTAVYTISFSASMLKLHVAVQNLAAKPLKMAFAFHTYLAVDDIRSVRVEGLDQTEYLNNLESRRRCPPSEIRTIDQEVDRIYLNQNEKPVVVHTASEGGRPKTLTISGENVPDAVLWNPWIEKTRGMSDIPDEGYIKFLCVEHGVVSGTAAVPSRCTWAGSQAIAVSYPPALA